MWEEFGKLSIIRQPITIQISTCITSLFVDPLIRQTFFRQMLEKSKYTKLSHYMINFSKRCYVPKPLVEQCVHRYAHP